MPNLPTRLYVGLALLLFASPVIAERPPLWLWVSVTGQASHAEHEDQIPRWIVQAAPALEGVILTVPSWQEAPGIASSVLIRRILDECRIHGIKVAWVRKLWITWDELTDGRPQRATDYVTTAYYVAAMRNLATEGAALGVERTGLDAEPYGGLVREAIKVGEVIPFAVHLEMAEAIERAKLYVPAPSFVTPGYHRLPDHWRWAVGHLAPEVMSQTSYRSRSPDHIHVTPNPPPDHTFAITWPGWWVVPGPWLADKPTPPPLEVWEFQTLDWAAWRAEFDGIRAVWIYTYREHLGLLCEQLGWMARREAG